VTDQPSPYPGFFKNLSSYGTVVAAILISPRCTVTVVNIGVANAVYECEPASLIHYLLTSDSYRQFIASRCILKRLS
jgi:hypothetical protein